MRDISFWYSYFGAIRLNPLLVELFRIMEENYPGEIEKMEVSKRLRAKGYSFKLISSEIDIISCSSIIQMNYGFPGNRILLKLSEFGKDALLNFKKEAPYQLKEIIIDIKKKGIDKYKLTLLKTCSVSLEYQAMLLSIGFKKYNPAYLRFSGKGTEVIKKLEDLLKNFYIRGKEEISEDWSSYLYLLERYGVFYQGVMGHYSYFILPDYQSFTFTKEEVLSLYKILEKGKRPIEWKGNPLYLKDFPEEEKLLENFLQKGFVKYVPSKDYYSLSSEGLYRINFLKKAQGKETIGIYARIRKVSLDKFEISFSNASFLFNNLKEEIYKLCKPEKEYPFIEVKNLSADELTRIFAKVMDFLE